MRRTAKDKALFEIIAEDLARLADGRSRARYIARRRECRRARIVSQLIEASRKNLRIDARKSLSLADAAITIARRLRRKNDLAISLRSKGNALYVLGENQDALTHHEQALRIFRINGDATQEARTLNASIQPHILLGQYDQALEAAEAAGKIFAQLGDKRHLAHLQINTGNIYHRQDRFEEALASYQRAYDMLSPLQDSEGLAVALYNVSVCLIALNDFPRALATYRRARKMCARDGMTLLVGQSDYNIAYLYYLRGEFTRAIALLQSARDLASKNGDEHILALCYLDLSDIYLELNLHAEARETAREGFRRFEKLGMGYERAKCIANEGLASSRLGDASRALRLLVRARAAFVREKNHAWPWLLDFYRALVLYNEGEFAKARKLCEQALEVLETSTMDGQAVLCGLLLARIDLKEANARKCAWRCGRAIERLSGLELPALNFKAYLLMGQAQRALENKKAAHSFLRKACEALEALRMGLHKDELKVAFMANRSEVYECLVDLCMNKEQEPRAVEEAFGYVEAAKSRALMDLMCQGPAQLPTVPAEQSQQDRRVRNLRAELHWYYRRIEQEQLRPEENSAERVKRLKQEASVREKALARSALQLPAVEQEPELLRDAVRISLQEIQSSLGTDTLIVEYFAVEDRLIAALVSAGQSRIVELTKLSRVTGLLQMLRFQLSRLSLGSQYASRFENVSFEATQKHLHELYAELLGPIGDLSTWKHLVFVPHGQLYAVPFHALFDGERYLIDRFSISYSPSASIYRLCQKRPSSVAAASLILGIPDERAPFIRDEIAAVSSTMRSPEVFLERQATEEVLREKGRNSRLIHIATHGTFRRDNPMFSQVSLGHSYLSVLDLYQLRLPADLITLSGCATGLNAVASGDEPVGLMRGLLSAGAKSLLLTLWDVHDRSTAEFMKRFYRYLHAGETKGESLRLAMCETRNSFPHPYYWAPFFLVGEVLGKGLA